MDQKILFTVKNGKDGSTFQIVERQEVRGKRRKYTATVPYIYFPDTGKYLELYGNPGLMQVASSLMLAATYIPMCKPRT